VVWDAPGAGGSSDPPESFGIAGYADCLASFIRGLDLDRPHVAGLSFGGIVALELSRRHPAIPKTLMLVSAYAGWTGSLPPEVAERRLEQAMSLSEAAPEDFVDALLPTMFSQATPPEVVERFGASLRTFHPQGFRAMARASSQDVRDALSRVAVPTLLIYGSDDERAPITVAHQLAGAISGSTLLVLAGAGHVCNIDAPDAFNRAVRAFLREHADG
jgi:pimeloyl-ACP methyl ester carboxylesterase